MLDEVPLDILVPSFHPCSSFQFGCPHDAPICSIFCSVRLNSLQLSFLMQVVGDGLLMSNPKRIERAIHESTCNALLLKVSAVLIFVLVFSWTIIKKMMV